MKVYRTLAAAGHDPRTSVTIGTFDGVHRGHRVILDELIRLARHLAGRSMVVTFHPHPQQVLRRHGDTVQVLTTLDERIDLLDAAGVDVLTVLDFTSDVASTPWRAFAQELIDSIGIGHMIFGHDHAFGRDREGTAQTVRKLGAEVGFGVTEVPPLLVDGETISSTKIRRALLTGDLDRAADYLGRRYSLLGRVIRGDGRGKTLGFPTANIDPLDRAKLIPMDGVYSVSVVIDGTEVRGMANIGHRPTFTDGLQRVLEVNLFDFDHDIYHNVVTVVFRKFVRSERKFGSSEEFQQQLQKDRIFCQEH